MISAVVAVHMLTLTRGESAAGKHVALKPDCWGLFPSLTTDRVHDLRQGYIICQKH